MAKTSSLPTGRQDRQIDKNICLCGTSTKHLFALLACVLYIPICNMFWTFMYILNIAMFSFCRGRIGLSSRWTSCTACTQSQAQVSLTNLLIQWISTQSCDNDTSWADLVRHTAGGRGGKAICSCKDQGGAEGWVGGLLWLLKPPTKQKEEKYIPPYLCPSLHPSLLRHLVSWCVDMDVWICYTRTRHNGLALPLC